MAEHLLNPIGSEFSATFVGRLVTTLIQKIGPAMLGDNLDLLLKAVLSKLQGARTLSVVQSLLMVSPRPCRLVLQKVASEFHPKVRNHGEGPY